ncbi:glycine/sarcosine/betaine reductase selenoprotein B family protein [Candidatus Chloroploca asiatica]|uniref:Selenoprotein B glycine/betaine/sarcosine/D-proline reductase n=1 Tax=Candidatus Chloroploca asiatica TaxID=1506545 RepID=A0A2H3KJT8_9CHLR|nr:glycine/sarcosine/betaine reductase selenoprotein B family protein [Candidatus Chloroploca asiatica]PDV98158.1 hypothetical protein A9Q02_03500 [Candidatus Chloroploca asiatica]
MSDFDGLRQNLSRMFGQVLSHVPALAQTWGRTFESVISEEVPFTRLPKPLREVRLALATTGGVHLRNQTPFDMADSRGDATFRPLPAATPREDLMITHDYYDHTNAVRDLNILFPLEHLRDLVAAGHIGSLGTCYGFMGHIEPPHLEALINETAPEAARLMREEGVDALLLTPG